MAFLKGDRNSDEYKRHIRTEENRTMGLLNIVVALAIAAVAYTDWVVVANLSMGYLYVLPIALSALVNPLALTFGLAVVCAFLEDLFGPQPDEIHLRVIRFVLGLAGFLAVGFFVSLIARQRNRLAAEVLRQRDEYARDLILASQVQRQVLPKPPVLSCLELAASMLPARLLGGDYYDFFQISERCDRCGDCGCVGQGRGGVSADAVAGGGAAASRAGVEWAGGDYEGPGRSVEADYESGDVCDDVLCAVQSGETNAGVCERRT